MVNKLSLFVVFIVFVMCASAFAVPDPGIADIPCDSAASSILRHPHPRSGRPDDRPPDPSGQCNGLPGSQEHAQARHGYLAWS